MSPASSTKHAPRELKKERIELRVAASAKELIQRAMAVSGLTAGDLAYEGADPDSAIAQLGGGWMAAEALAS